MTRDSSQGRPDARGSQCAVPEITARIKGVCGCSVALGRPMLPLVLSEGEIQQLQSIASSRSLPHSIVQRAQIILACGAGETNTSIAKRMGMTGMTVGKWRKRYRDLGLEGLHDELRPGRPRTYEDDTVAEVINRALQTKPTDGSTQWSARSLAAATGISKTTVHRWLQTFSVQPHRQKSFKLSTDPFFVEKVRDIVGLYLNPPDKAMGRVPFRGVKPEARMP